MGKTIAFITTAAMGLCTIGSGDRPSSFHGNQHAVAGSAMAQPDLAPEARARAAVAAMTLDEKLRLIFGYSDQALHRVAKVPDDIVPPELKTDIATHQVKGSAGFVPGVPRLGIPDQMADRCLDGRAQ